MTTTTTIPAKKTSVKATKTLTSTQIARAGLLSVTKSSKITLKVTSGATSCKVVGATLKGLKKGTCKVLASVKTGSSTKTSTVTVTVS